MIDVLNFVFRRTIFFLDCLIYVFSTTNSRKRGVWFNNSFPPRVLTNVISFSRNMLFRLQLYLILSQRVVRDAGNCRAVEGAPWGVAERIFGEAHRDLSHGDGRGGGCALLRLLLGLVVFL